MHADINTRELKQNCLNIQRAAYEVHVRVTLIHIYKHTQTQMSEPIFRYDYNWSQPVLLGQES